MLLTMILACVYRRHLHRQIKKVPTLIRNLDQRDYMGAAATVLAPWCCAPTMGHLCICVIMYSSTRIKWDGSHAPPERLLHHRLFALQWSLVTVWGPVCSLTTATTWGNLWGPVALILMLRGPVSNKIREYRNPCLIQQGWPLYIVPGQSAEEPCRRNIDSGIMVRFGVFEFFLCLEDAVFAGSGRILFVIAIRIVLKLCNALFL